MTRQWRLAYDQTAHERWHSDKNDRVRARIEAIVPINGESGGGCYSDKPADLTCDAEFEFDGTMATMIEVVQAVAEILGMGRRVRVTEVES